MVLRHQMQVSNYFVKFFYSVCNPNPHHHDEMYARKKWPLPLCILFGKKTFFKHKFIVVEVSAECRNTVTVSFPSYIVIYDGVYAYFVLVCTAKI